MKASRERLYKDVEFLTEISPFRNYQNTESLKACSEYIYQEFKTAGLNVSYQEFEVNGTLYRNVIASYHPEGKRRLIVGAHYDVCGNQPGADDNASAVAGLLETARLLMLQKPEMDYRIDFVAYCLEEPPFFATEHMGSFIHAQSLYKSQVEVIGMICYEMIGYFSDEPGSQPYPSPELTALYPDTGNFIVVVGILNYRGFNEQVKVAMQTSCGIDVQSIHFPDQSGLAGLSDHRNYWQFGYPALMINDTAFLRNPNYHEITDTIETLDFDKMAEVVNGVYAAVTGF